MNKRRHLSFEDRLEMEESGLLPLHGESPMEEEEEEEEEQEEELDDDGNPIVKEHSDDPELDDDGNPIVKDEKPAVGDDTEVEIEVDGKKEKFTLAELKKGYLRQSDYTKKMQDLSKEKKTEIINKATDVIENKDEFPEEDVKAAEYFLKIAKAKFGLMTRDELEAEKSKESAVADFQKRMTTATEEVTKMVFKDDKGVEHKMPKFDEDEIIDWMKETGIHNPLAAYKDKYESELQDFIIKRSKGSTSYRSDKTGKKPAPTKKEHNVRTQEGHRDFIGDLIDEMSEK